MISTIGPDRVMMGADLPSNVPVEIAKFKALDLEPEVYAQVMGKTAIEVFNLSKSRTRTMQNVASSRAD